MWRRAQAHVRTAAEQRLAHVARQWRPVDPTAEAWPPRDAWAPAEPEARRGFLIGPWGRPALRGLALLVALVLAVAAYGAWSGRPRAVAQAPEVLASGTALSGTPVDGEPGMASPSAASPSASATSADAPSAEAARPTPAAAVPDVVVHVAGLVARPGLVRLPVGSRVADAIAEAGGVTRRRAADSVNLARVLVDGEQVVVTDAPPVATTAEGAVAAPGVPAVVDLNSATAESLDELPGVGPVIAARILAWRSTNGPFRSVEELVEVSGIGESILAQVRSLVRV